MIKSFLYDLCRENFVAYAHLQGSAEGRVGRIHEGKSQTAVESYGAVAGSNNANHGRNAGGEVEAEESNVEMQNMWLCV